MRWKDVVAATGLVAAAAGGLGTLFGTLDYFTANKAGMTQAAGNVQNSALWLAGGLITAFIFNSKVLTDPLGFVKETKDKKFSSIDHRTKAQENAKDLSDVLVMPEGSVLDLPGECDHTSPTIVPKSVTRAAFGN